MISFFTKKVSVLLISLIGSGSSISEWHSTYNQCDQIGRFIGLWASFTVPLATINLPKSLTFLGNFFKGVKIYHFSNENIFGQLL